MNFQPSTENAIVSESEGRLQVCLMKDADTARPVQIDIIVRETIPSDNSATGMLNYNKCFKATLNFYH